MLIKVIPVIFLVTSYLNSVGQIDIYLRDFKINMTPKKCNDQRVIYLPDSSYIKVNLINCKGKMTIQQFDHGGLLILRGEYSASLDTLKEYASEYDLFGDLTKIKVHKYFEPLKNGVWFYYQNSQISRREEYKKGVLIKK